MKVKHRIFILVAIGWLGMVAIASVGMSSLLQDESVFKVVTEKRIPKMEYFLRLRGAATDLVRRGYEILSKSELDAATQRSELQRLQQYEQEAIRNAAHYIKELESTPFVPQVQAMWERFQAMWEPWHKYDIDISEALDNAIASGTQESTAALFKTIHDSAFKRRDATPQLASALDELIGMQSNLNHDTIAEALAGTAHDFVVMGIIIALGLGVLSGFTWSIVRSAIKPLSEARDTVSLIAENLDLTLRLGNKSKDEIGELSQSFDYMMGRLQKAFQTIQNQIDEVAKTVEAVATGAEQVAQSSSSQSSSASAMAASIEEMSVSINTVSSSATEARAMAQAQGDISEQGNQIIEQTCDKMAAIARIVSNASKVIKTLGEESHQITNVVNVIKEVADQTNLLALNAAIEAARAGEQGRGFAVVADEVRKLAERTAQSTVDISGMVGKIQASTNEAVEEMAKVVDQVKTGESLAKDAGERMKTIRQEAAKVSAAVTEISDALKEQSQASHDVARHVESIAQMTDQNNAAAEESAANAKKLDQLADEVNSALSHFKVQEAA